MSNIRVFVQWKSSTVFAGEEIECQIIFKNVSQAPSICRMPSSPEMWSPTSARERWRESLPSQLPRIPFGHFHNTSGTTSQTILPRIGAHRTAFSLNSSPAPRHEAVTNFSSNPSREVVRQKHKRSVSIVSISGEATLNEKYMQGSSLGLKWPDRGHARAASLQVLTDKGVVDPVLISSKNLLLCYQRFLTSLALASGRVGGPSPLLKASSPAEQPFGFKEVKSRGGKLIAVDSPRTQRNASDSIYSSFRFPQGTASMAEVSRFESVDALTRSLSPRRKESRNGIEPLNPITRILSSTSMTGSPRSSAEFYGTSNNSTETLASEYATRNPGWQSQNETPGRRLHPSKNEKAVENLMMGYGHITGSFILDASLVNQAPFEEVKRKGIIGGQDGGGVVRAEASKRDGGLFGSLGWGSIGGSLGGLLGSNELSSIKATKDIASMRSIPILSTPQSVFFVDLQLGPGESRSYTYSHRLPSGIPPTHKGRAMKVSYNLTIGTQRAVNSTIQHHIRTVDIPFRVLTGVNSKGSSVNYLSSLV